MIGTKKKKQPTNELAININNWWTFFKMYDLTTIYMFYSQVSFL